MNAPAGAGLRALGRTQTGITMLELMAVVVILSIVSALAVPLYISYEESAMMQKANFHYREAVRIASRGYVEDSISVAYGTNSERPRNAEGWIELFSRSNPVAPGGGPAFVAGEFGSAATGAIGVIMVEDRITLVRPAYLELTAHRAIIHGDKVSYSPSIGG